MSGLEELDQQIARCTACPLWKGRTQAVPGEGSEKAEILFIGEAPGYHEDRQGRPFVGPAGKFLDELLNSIGIQRREVYITNTVKCRPPNNRDPLPGEIEACRIWLEQQIRMIRPKVIVTLGRHSLSLFFPKENITRIRGKPRKWNEFVIYPMLHPAAALHQQGLRKTIEEDIKQLPLLLKETGHLEEKEQVQQLRMF